MKNLKNLSLCVVMLVLLAVATGINNSANANITVVDMVDDSDGQANTYFSSIPTDTDATRPSPTDTYRWWNEDWGWTHTFSPPGLPPGSIISATLTIEAWDVDTGLGMYPEVDEIYVGTDSTGIFLGDLNNLDESWGTTILPLPTSTFADLMDGTINIFMDIDTTHNQDFWAVTLKSSTLTVTITALTPETMLAETALFIMDEVDAGNIDAELEGSLLAKIDAALAALDRGNPNDAKVAMNDLKALINQVEALVDKKITEEAAAEIIRLANEIIAELGG